MTNTQFDPDKAYLQVQASVAATTINTMVVEVTAADIPDPLVFNLEISDGIASGTVQLPAGPDRTITVRAFDASGMETHRGELTIDVVAGTNAAVSIVLVPLTGEVPIEVILGRFELEITPAESSLVVGDTLQLRAIIVDGQGNVIEGSVSWATLNPAVASVSTSGLVETIGEGKVQIVATFHGNGAASTVTVTAAPAPPSVVHLPGPSPSTTSSLTDTSH